jgi:hypothetical protein
MTNPTQRVPVSELQPNDTVLIDGAPTTVGASNLRRCPFMGATLYGNTYATQGRKVDLVLFPKWYKGEIVAYVRQI